MSIIGTRNKAIAIISLRIEILCLSPYSLPISVQIFHSVYMCYNLEADGRNILIYSLCMKSDWLTFLFLSRNCATVDNYISLISMLFLSLFLSLPRIVFRALFTVMNIHSRITRTSVARKRI